MRAVIKIVLLTLFVVACAPVTMDGGQKVDKKNRKNPPVPVVRPDPACEVKEITKTADGLRMYSYDGDQWVSNRKDENGIYQIYLNGIGKSETCLTCRDIPNGPKRGKHKTMPHWHPNGKWIMVAVERDTYDKPIIRTKNMMEGLMLTGLFVNMFAMKSDGSEWVQMTDYSDKKGQPNGYTGPNFTPDGRRAAWAHIVDGNPIGHLFGKWEMVIADFSEVRGKPTFSNMRNITPKGALWLEPGNFGPDGRSLLITADIGMKDPQGQDQYILDVDSGQITNLNTTPKIWDEHGVFSPDGEKVFFMTSYPFRDDPWRHGFLSLRAEFMLMDRDGSNLRQISHFLDPKKPNTDKKNGIAANGEWHPDGRSISAQSLTFPNVQSWNITFMGNCGNRGRS